MSYRVIVFDWDGTLMDSAEAIVKALQLAAQDNQVPIHSEQAIKNIIGLELSLAIKTLYPEYNDERIAQIRESYAQHFVSQNDRSPARLFNGVKEGLAALHGRGYELAIATGKSRRGLDRVLPDSGVAHWFGVTRCADETASKPAPDMLHEIIAAYDVAPHQVLMVGDTEFDMEMARRANVDRAAVSYGAHALSRLKTYAPKLCVNNFEELINWLLKRC